MKIVFVIVGLGKSKTSSEFTKQSEELAAISLTFGKSGMYFRNTWKDSDRFIMEGYRLPQ